MVPAPARAELLSSEGGLERIAAALERIAAAQEKANELNAEDRPVAALPHRGDVIVITALGNVYRMYCAEGLRDEWACVGNILFELEVGIDDGVDKAARLE